MEKLSSSDERAITELASRHGFSYDAVKTMWESSAAGNGTMAQFSHSEFGGAGQWMSGGMIMVSDMFNHPLKARVEKLCYELATLIENTPAAIGEGSTQSQHQERKTIAATETRTSSLFIPPRPGSSHNWWPADLGSPTSTGAQNDVRYAYFSTTHRLAIEINGEVTVYDTLNHEIGGFSQQQSHGSSLSFDSQYGLIDISKLPVMSVRRKTM